MDGVNGNFSKGEPLVLAKSDLDASGIKSLAPDEIDGLKDRAASLQDGIAAAGAPDGDGDATVFYSLLSDKQDKELEKAAVYGEDNSVVNKGEESALEVDEDDEDDEDDNVGAKPQDALDLGRFGYTKEQVDGWIAQGYSLSDIKNGIAASGEKNTEVTNVIPNKVSNEVPSEVTSEVTNAKPSVKPDEITNGIAAA